jgi:hypothetical protein
MNQKFDQKGDSSMKNALAVFVLLAVLMAAGVSFAQSFGVYPAMDKTAPVASVGPTIASDMAKEGYVPTGPDGTPIPAPVRGFDPGNGQDSTFGSVAPLATPKAQ